MVANREYTSIEYNRYVRSILSILIFLFSLCLQTVSEVPCIRIPLQSSYVSPTSPETAIFMYSSNTDNQGNVELHLRDTNEINEKAFTSVFGKLESDPDSYTISYQDDSGAVLHQNNIDILLGAAALQSNGKTRPPLPYFRH